jgi:hypothetical protein
VLAQIVDESLIPGVHVLGLVEPVVYLKGQGSHASTSSAPFTARQSAYDERVFHRGTLRTPQVVVDGQVEAMGDDFGPIQRAVVRAAQFGKAAVTIDATLAPDANELDLSAQITVTPEVPTFETTQVFVAVTAVIRHPACAFLTDGDSHRNKIRSCEVSCRSARCPTARARGRSRRHCRFHASGNRQN